MLKHLSALLLFISAAHIANAQTATVTGTFKDSATKEGLIGLSILFENVSDASIKAGAVTDVNGYFKITLTPGTYSVKGQYLGYKDYVRRMNITADINLGNILLSQVTQNLKNITYTITEQRTQQKGDTSEINANAYKTTKDANAQDLLTKMPGITNENGTLKHQGEQIQQVLVDGKPFFGDDPSASLKNLPAEVVDKVQIYDRMSDQSLFSGFDDGNTTKTVNIVTKANAKTGQFGRFYAGYGTDDRYTAGFSANFFKGARRFSVLGMSNNINQQNFSIDDLLGATGTSMGGHGNFAGRQMSGGHGYGMGSLSNFMVGPQPGITNTNALGLNYSNYIGKKIYITGSYFFNYSNSVSRDTLNRTYITTAGKEFNPTYQQRDSNNMKNMNNRISLRMDYNIDSNNTLVIIPKFSYQTNNNYSNTAGINFFSPGQMTSSTLSELTRVGSGYNFDNTVLYRHRFGNSGRNISLNIGTNLNNKLNTSTLNSHNIYARTGGFTDSAINQQTNNTSNGYSISPNLSYVEPLSKKVQMMLTYNPTFSQTLADKETKNQSAGNEYTQLDTALTNKFNSHYISQQGGVTMKYTYKIASVIGGVMYKNTELYGDQTYPVAYNVNHSYDNVLPSLQVNLKFSQTTNLRLNYRTQNTIPSISQLQNVIDNTNPLNLYQGNPNLNQEYTHNLFARFGKTFLKSGRNFSVFVFGSKTDNYIGNSTILARHDSILNSNGSQILLPAGSQFTQPVNLSGNQSVRGFVTFGTPLKFIKSNLNINSGFNYSHIPGLVNNQLNLSNYYTVSPGFTVSSNISEKIDFTVGYYAYFNKVNNTLQASANSNYFYHSAYLKFDWIFWKGFAIHTDATDMLYQGLGASFNQQYLIWNLSVGKKFLKNQNAELNVSVYDLLNQNQSITRNVTETYIEDQQTTVLRRYFMLNFIYTLRNFKGNAGNMNGNLNGNPNGNSNGHAPMNQHQGPPPSPGTPPPPGK